MFYNKWLSLFFCSQAQGVLKEGLGLPPAMTTASTIYSPILFPAHFTIPALSLRFSVDPRAWLFVMLSHVVMEFVSCSIKETIVVAQHVYRTKLSLTGYYTRRRVFSLSCCIWLKTRLPNSSPILLIA